MESPRKPLKTTCVCVCVCVCTRAYIHIQSVSYELNIYSVTTLMDSYTDT